jgi:hypothetical protein
MVILSKWARQTNVAYRTVKYNGIGIIREPVIAENGREDFEKQTTYFIKKDKANGKKIKQVV